MDKTRIDKWLWAVRFFKTRTLATEVCDKGHVKVNDESVKPARLISEGTMITVRINQVNREIKVLKVIDKRVGAPLAQACYEDLTPADRLIKPIDGWDKYGSIQRKKGEGRPTKRERRNLDDFFDW